MTKTQIERLVKAWKNRLGLERWDVKIDWEKPCDTDRVAEVEKSAYYDTATLRWETTWQKWVPEYAEQTVVHELLHLCHRDVDESFNDLEGQLQRDAWILSERRYRQAMEGFIDRTASRLVELAGESCP